MNRKTLNSFVNHVKRIALEAGRAILEISLAEDDVRTKADGTPVTRADTASHEIIVSALARLKPRFPIISEEGDIDVHECKGQSFDTYWLVDPLDGTKEFLKENGEYTVNIALIENAWPVLGVVYAPALDVLYYAAQGLDAWKSGSSGSKTRLEGRGSTHPVTAVISRSHPSTETDAYLARFNVAKVIRRGSSIKLCAVAEGEADIYPRLNTTSLWDTAAGAAIAREAGCKVEDIEGNDLLYDFSKGVLRKGFVVYVPRICNMNKR